jgi:hypothetical protein
LKPGEKRRKIPFGVDGRAASSTDPETWLALADARSDLASGRYDGLNFASGSHEDGWHYAIVDIDDAKDEASNLKPDAQEILNLANSYGETSPSGTGVRIVLRSKTPYHFPRHRVTGYNVEIEDGDKFGSLTGNHISGTPTTLSDGRAAIAYIQKQFAARAKSDDQIVGQAGTSPLSDAEIVERIRRAKNGARFDDLISGKPFSDESAADFELARILAFWSNRDPVQIELMISASERGQRDKWKDRPDYRSRTIEAAIRATRAVFASDPTIDRNVRPVLLCLADVQSRQVQWLWPNRVPFGKLTLLAGYPGFGKSILSLYMTKCVTTGQPWPDGSPCPLGDVLIISAEDDPADTLRPRLDGLAADVNRVHTLSMVQKPNDGAERMFTLADLPALEAALQRIPDCKLVIVDPVGSFVGGGTETHRDNEIRSVLAPVATLAEKYGVAVLIVAHRRKAAGERADDSVLGSVGFVGIARATWHLTRDREDKARRLLLPGKMNLCREPTGLAFQITGDPPTLQWEPEPVLMSADDALAQQNAADTPGPEATARDRAEIWLRERLADGCWQPVAEIKTAAENVGLAWRTLQRAADEIDVERNQPKAGGPGHWRLSAVQASPKA